MAEWPGAVTKAFKIDPRRDSTNSRVLLRQSLIDKGYGKFDSTSEYQLTSFTIRFPAGTHSWDFTGRLYHLPPHCGTFDHVQSYPLSEEAGRMVNQNKKNLISCGVTEKFTEKHQS